MPNFVVTEMQARNVCVMFGVNPEDTIRHPLQSPEYDILMLCPRWIGVQYALQETVHAEAK